MQNNLIFEIYFQKKHINNQIFEQLWHLLPTPFLEPHKFGITEPPKFFYAKEPTFTAFQIFEKDDLLIFDKSKNNFLSFDHLPRKKITCLRGNIAINQDFRFSIFFDWIKTVCNLIKPIYGMACDELEYDHKHKDVQILENGGVSTGYLGVSHWDFLEFLPGIYYLNIFGGELLNFISSDSFTKFSNSWVRESGDKIQYFYLNEDFISLNLETRLLKEQELANILGNELFFDRFLLPKQFTYPNNFKVYLKNLD